MKTLNIDTWDRKEQFLFFKDFEEPFWGVSIDADCTKSYNYCKKEGISFFLFYLHCSLVAANQTEPFRYRITDNQVVVYDTVNASPTINRDNGTFGFAYIDYNPNFFEFKKNAETEINRVRSNNDFVPAGSGVNVIHYSSLPWIKFTSLSHARRFASADSCPIITFGKLSKTGKKVNMPVSIHVHHALMDGYHVGKFIELFSHALDITP